MVRPIWVEAMVSDGRKKVQDGETRTRCFKMRCPEIPFGFGGKFLG